jgi:hypothetical protein
MRRLQPRLIGALVLVAWIASRAREAGADVGRPDLDLGGFIESSYTVRLADAACGETRACELMLGEQHLQARLAAYSALGDAEGLFQGRVDVMHDLVLGRSSLDPLELYVDAKYRDVLVRIGRQIITWGSGDLLFVNDVFPKDWESFYLGRSLEYLKLGVDAVRITAPHLDLVLVPRTVLDRAPGRDRFVLPDSPWARLPVGTSEYPLSLKDGEVALRLSGMLAGWEFNLYGAWTHLHEGVVVPDDLESPMAVEVRAPRLLSIGGSIAGAVPGGLWNLEGGYRRAQEDPAGTDPIIPNSSLKVFTGYAHGLWQDAAIGIQASLETMLQHGEYLSSRPAGAPRDPKYDWLFTFRFTQQLFGQTLDLGTFLVWGATQRDAYALIYAHYRYNDVLSLDVVSNLFFGANRFSSFGGLVENTNLHSSIRYAF